MPFKNKSIKRKHIFIHTYQYLWELENVLESIEINNASDFQISILKKVSQNNLDMDYFLGDLLKKSKNRKDINYNFGTFNSPEIGNIFVIGALASIFLHKVNEKYLSALSSGTYGIFRGLGFNETQTTLYLKMLYNGNYLLILRGFKKNIA